MKVRKIAMLCGALGLLAAFILWTVLVCIVDLQPIAPDGSDVGFAVPNRAFHNFTGVHWWLYTVTDWLGLIPLTMMLGFAVLGLVQWIQRKSLLRVDFSILALGGFYIVVLLAFLLFEGLVINVRPVLINGVAEASYPSSTTMLGACVLPTTMLQLRRRIRHPMIARGALIALIALTAFMVIGRLLSGVHWLSDIIGGILISAGLVLLYAWAVTDRM